VRLRASNAVLATILTVLSVVRIAVKMVTTAQATTHQLCVQQTPIVPIMIMEDRTHVPRAHTPGKATR